MMTQILVSTRTYPTRVFQVSVVNSYPDLPAAYWEVSILSGVKAQLMKK